MDSLELHQGETRIVHISLHRSVDDTHYQQEPSFGARHHYIWQWPGFPGKLSCKCHISQPMAEAFFETNFLLSLRELADPRHRGLFSTLRDVLPASVISEAQMSIPSAFNKPAKFVCDALRWLTARGKIIHIAGISKTLTPYGMLLTASADIQMDTEKTSLDYVPLAILKSPALLCNVQQQPMEIQRLVHQWDPTYRAIANKEIKIFLQKHLKPPDADMNKVSAIVMKEHLYDPIRDYLPQYQWKVWAEWQKHGHKQILEHIMALPKLLPAKNTSNLTAEDHHQLSLHVLSWLADHVALPHLRTLHKFKGQIPSISIENAREQPMNSILFMNTANDLNRIHRSGTISWITAPTYALMIPDNAHPMSSDHIDLLSDP